MPRKNERKNKAGERNRSRKKMSGSARSTRHESNDAAASTRTGPSRASAAKRSASSAGGRARRASSTRTTRRSASSGAASGPARAAARKPARAASTSGRSASAKRRKTAPKASTTRRASSTVKGRSRAASLRRQAAPRGGYSDSARRALWIESPDQHADRPGQTLATQNHDVIRQWAEERGAVPATVPGTERDGRPGVLRFDFPDYGGGRLRPVDWDEWFETFDARRLVFLFQEQMKSKSTSNFFRLDSPERKEG